MDKQPELSVADFFAFGNAAAAKTVELNREDMEVARPEPVDDADD